MKVSLNLVKEFTKVDLPIDELVAKINQQLGSVETVTDLGQRYTGAVIVKILSCDDHPDADRLHICVIDDGGVTAGVERDNDGHVQVVCGAPNARAGISVVWLPPGSTVPSSFVDAEPFVLGSRPLRGVVSHGMLASPKELGIGDSHEGILEVGDEQLAGTPFAAAYGLDDTIIDIENKMFTHRPDLFGVLGVAREIAGILGQPFVSPQWYLNQVPANIYMNFKDTPEYEPDTALPLEIGNDAGNLVPRLVAVTVKDVTVKPSPLWLQVALVRLGARPINNIVDITNYTMLLTGQPLHAYDYDKLATGKLTARMARAGEPLKLLNEKTLTLTEDDIVITDGERTIGLGGVMGGADTEVSAETKNIILECATFDMYAIRKTSMRHGIFSDAVTRFNKGQSSAQNDTIANYATALLIDVAGGSFQAVYDTAYQNSGLMTTIDVERSFINSRLGLDLDTETIATLLENVEFDVESLGDGWAVAAPFWRTDIQLPEDIVEEVGRLFGFDKLPRHLPERSIKPAAKNRNVQLKQTLRSGLARLGSNEVLTYSFVHQNVLTRSGQDFNKAYKLSNALSPDLQYYRLSLVPSLLDKINLNLKSGYDEFALFELGKSHVISESTTEVPEYQGLSFVYAAKHSRPGAAYYVAKQYLMELMQLSHATDQLSLVSLSQAGLIIDARLEQLAAPFDPNRSAYICTNDTVARGVVGEFKSSVRKAFKLPVYSAGFEIDVDVFSSNKTAFRYTPLPRFPMVRQDISLRISTSLDYQKLYNAVATSLMQQESGTMFSSLTPLTIYQNPDDTEYKNISFRYSVASYDKTMTDPEIAAMLDVAARAAAEAYQAERI